MQLPSNRANGVCTQTTAFSCVLDIRSSPVSPQRMQGSPHCTSASPPRRAGCTLRAADAPAGALAKNFPLILPARRRHPPTRTPTAPAAAPLHLPSRKSLPASARRSALPTNCAAHPADAIPCFSQQDHRYHHLHLPVDFRCSVSFPKIIRKIQKGADRSGPLL